MRSKTTGTSLGLDVQFVCVADGANMPTWTRGPWSGTVPAVLPCPAVARFMPASRVSPLPATIVAAASNLSIFLAIYSSPPQGRLDRALYRCRAIVAFARHGDSDKLSALLLRSPQSAALTSRGIHRARYGMLLIPAGLDESYVVRRDRGADTGIHSHKPVMCFRSLLPSDGPGKPRRNVRRQISM